MRSSFRLKIVLWYTAVTLVTLLVFRLTSVQMIRLSLYEDFDDSLRAEAEWVRSLLYAYQARNIPDAEIREDIAARSMMSPRKEFIEIHRRDGSEYFYSADLEVERLLPHARRALLEPVTIPNFRGRPLRLYGIADSSFQILVGYPLADIDAAVHKIISSFVVLIPVALLLLAAGGLFLVSRFVRPLQDLNAYADRLMQEPLERALPALPVRTRDELGTLALRIHALIEKMRSSMRQVLSFASLASHELRTPLAIVRNQLENALRPKVPAGELRQTIASLYDEVLRLNRIVDDLLSLATMQAGNYEMKPRRLAVHDLLREFHEEAAMLAREKNIEVHLRPGPEVFVTADLVRVRQVLFNLLDNALKHTPEHGRIELGHEVVDDRLVLRFADNGAGIPAAKLERICDLFRNGSQHGHSLPGAGLGLALVRGIVVAHKGDIAVDSMLGRGTQFTIRLPLVMADTSGATPEPG